MGDSSVFVTCTSGIMSFIGGSGFSVVLAGGALAANVHGRGLTLRPIIGDVESFTLMDADGRLTTCSRTENGELFRLAIGGYGLFGIVTRVRLRLMPRTKLDLSYIREIRSSSC